LIDEIGIDITIDIAETLEKAYGPRDQPPELLRKMQSEKLLGRKNGAGFYRYEGKQQTPNESLKAGRTNAPEAQTDNIANRLVFLMVNEAARCLEERVVASPADADYGMVLGTGFPVFRGGPLRFAEDFGLKRVVDEMDRLVKSDQKFAPCEILRQHAREGTRFYAE
jgi:3-hydroxyacyl-CoA dehydrogenase/enoyl-CoA hydratase/3-hydroxybutyryl-CoA epimerase